MSSSIAGAAVQRGAIGAGVRLARSRGPGPGRARARTGGRWTLGLVVLLAVACAGPFTRVEEGEAVRLRHRRLGYGIDVPSVLGRPGWSRRDVEDSDLLLRHDDGSAWALASSCRSTRASAKLLADALARAADGDGRREGRAVHHARLDGFQQRLERIEASARLWIETVTLRGARCTYDWILIAPSSERLEEMAPAFDAWWRSFEPAGEELEREGAG